MNTSETLQTPILLYLICAMSATAFVISAGMWLWRVAADKGNAQDFSRTVYTGQLYAFLSVMIISIGIGLYRHDGATPLLSDIGGELLILSITLLYTLFQAKRSNRPVTTSLIYAILRVITFSALCLLGWAVSIGTGFAIVYAITLPNFAPAQDAIPVAVFITGALWSAPVIILYTLLKNHPQKKAYLHGQALYRYLWPVLIAYAVLLAPLMIQYAATAEDWKKTPREKPIRTVHPNTSLYKIVESS